MKAKLIGQGNDGTAHYEAGAVVERDSEWLRRMIVNGMAEPQDDEARAFAANTAQHAGYVSTALSAALGPESAKVSKR